MSHGQKCFISTVLDHLLDWERGRGLALGLFQDWKGSAFPWLYPKHFSHLFH